jgi:hypothetical protein
MFTIFFSSMATLSTVKGQKMGTQRPVSRIINSGLDEMNGESLEGFAAFF